MKSKQLKKNIKGINKQICKDKEVCELKFQNIDKYIGELNTDIKEMSSSMTGLIKATTELKNELVWIKRLLYFVIGVGGLSSSPALMTMIGNILIK